MVTIALPDGSHKDFSEALTVQQLAQTIGTGLAAATIGGKVDGKLVDASYLLPALFTSALIRRLEVAGRW
ncbi:TGS domain-containing protein, partial [uncultured Cobetia sp.]|uniref:TGS domain-containing protein n=1 Tax=uncultured Cobetia sp. TaxID=410706 RepID=UPI0030EC23B9